MKMLNQLIGALVEAWGEVKGQKSRVILSLVGVVAAVAAMSTVIALGDLMVQSSKEMLESSSGRATTLHVTVSKESSSSSGESASDAGASAPGTAGDEGNEGWSSAATGVVNDPIGKAMLTVAERLKIPYWSRMESAPIELTEIIQAQNSGLFQGRAVAQPEFGWQGVSVKAVDPNYSVIFRIKPQVGRWIDDADIDQRVTPIVINSILWDYMGRFPIDGSQPILLTANDGSGARFRVVGVVQSPSQWDSPTAYMNYDAWQLLKTPDKTGQGGANTEMLVWAGADQADQARKILPKAVAAVMGQGWSGKVQGGETLDAGQSQINSIQRGIMVVGGIVIFLGALGLLNVAIVTVRQRVREIGIRRAMGASAMRVFFAVFLESVVATFVAGVLGVALAVIIVRFMPLESLYITLQERPSFPVSAAVVGVSISTAIGALCGIIPAFAAIKVKPIDAIRY
ncbi:ABC transporter permease [Schaalia vaccimaxillae]|uniref:ABC transporter permease n=1 Tax=Schaalia vaccimaxillae TaxID=183916 RepID=UPI0003B770B0|nr:ABC transporter permease [Schaalia vaccimaxillae]